jgi:hypothetical protein
MNQYEVKVRLSADPRRTLLFTDNDSFTQSLIDGCYPDGSFVLDVDADSHLAAAEVAFAVCNSYAALEPNRFDELHCSESYRPVVAAYREAGNRSLSTGDVIEVRDADGWNRADGLYGCARVGWVKLPELVMTHNGYVLCFRHAAMWRQGGNDVAMWEADSELVSLGCADCHDEGLCLECEKGRHNDCLHTLDGDPLSEPCRCPSHEGECGHGLCDKEVIEGWVTYVCQSCGARFPMEREVN